MLLKLLSTLEDSRSKLEGMKESNLDHVSSYSNFITCQRQNIKFSKAKSLSEI